MFSLSQEYQLWRTNGDVERPGGEKLTKSKNETREITQSKEGTYTLTRINSFLYYKIYFILHLQRFVKLDSCTSLFSTSISYLL